MQIQKTVNTKEIGDRVKHLRKSRGITQEDDLELHIDLKL